MKYLVGALTSVATALAVTLALNGQEILGLSIFIAYAAGLVAGALSRVLES